jgi:hypothetical protein
MTLDGSRGQSLKRNLSLKDQISPKIEKGALSQTVHSNGSLIPSEVTTYQEILLSLMIS